MKKIIILIFLCIISTGCYNYREINDLAIVTAIGIEKTNDKYLVTTQIVNIKKVDSETGNQNISKIVVYKATGKDIVEALKNIADKSSKSLFYSHVELVILDDDVIKNDLTNTIDFFARNPEIGVNFDVVTSTTDSPNKILEILTPMDPLPSNDLVSLIKENEKQKGTSNEMSFEELLNFILQKGVNPIYTDIIIEGNKNNNNNTEDLNKSNPNATIVIKNLVSFNKDKNEVKLTRNESIGYNFINNNIERIVITSKCKNSNKYFSVELSSSKSKYNLNLKDNELDININATSNISEYNCNNNLSKTFVNKELKNITQKQIEKYINQTIRKAKNSNNDFIGIGNYIYKNNPKYFKESSWEEKDFKKLKINVNVKLQIISEGNLKNNITGSEIYE